MSKKMQLVNWLTSVIPDNILYPCPHIHHYPLIFPRCDTLCTSLLKKKTNCPGTVVNCAVRVLVVSPENFQALRTVSLDSEKKQKNLHSMATTWYQELLIWSFFFGYMCIYICICTLYMHMYYIILYYILFYYIILYYIYREVCAYSICI
jgi:hypothetical protein